MSVSVFDFQLQRYLQSRCFVSVHTYIAAFIEQPLKAGDFFGERALLTGDPRAANITGKSNTVAHFRLPRHLAFSIIPLKVELFVMRISNECVYLSLLVERNVSARTWPSTGMH